MKMIKYEVEVWMKNDDFDVEEIYKVMNKIEKTLKEDEKVVDYEIVALNVSNV